VAATPIPAFVGEPDENGMRRLACGRSRDAFGVTVPHRQGGRIFPLSVFVPGLVKLDHVPGSTLPHFGIPRGMLLHPDRVLRRQQPRNPVGVPPLFPRRTAGGAAAKKPVLKPGKNLRTYEPQYLLHCPGCGRTNHVDVAMVGADGPARPAIMEDKLKQHPDRAES
jgi:hypothetical protein